MMTKKTTWGFALACILVAAAIAFASGYLISGSRVKNITTASAGSANERVSEVDKVIHDNYLGTINEAEMENGMVKGYVEGLGDPSVKYLTAAEYANYNKSAAGETIIYKNFGKGVGYIQFLSFTDSTKKSFSDALNDFSGSTISKVDMLVLDLRNCNTGDIDVAASLLDMLLPEGETIAGVDKNGKRTVLYTSDQSEISYDIAVLVNGNTQGVAEIFASTLAAYGKANIVGTTTMGDSAKTEAVQLKNGDYVLIPSLYYVTKGQQTYSATGVVPAMVVELSASDQKSYDSGTLELSADPQFLAAVKALGINDIVMPAGTSSDKQSDTDKGSDTDKDKSSDTDTEEPEGNSDTDVAHVGPASSDTDTDSSEQLDPYWDDKDYWNSRESSGSNDEDYNDDGGYDDEDDYGYDYNDYDDEDY